MRFATLLDADGRLRDTEAIRVALSGANDPDAVYCGSGVTAAVVVAAAEHAGIDLKLFPGSWSQWSAETSRPVETGD